MMGRDLIWSVEKIRVYLCERKMRAEEIDELRP